MKSIKKIKESSKAVAGTALLVGATLAGGAAFATAQSSGSSGDATLGDYPGHFINDDGTVSSTVVMGEDAASIDVVAGAQIAGQLGNNAFSTETVSAGGAARAGTWTADNGVTLNRRNTNLFIYDTTGDGKTRLDSRDISALEDTSFQSADNNEVDVEQDINVGSQAQQFSAEGDYDDPILSVNNPSSGLGPNTNLFSATVEFSDSIDFTTAGDGDEVVDADEYLEDGDEIEMFGTEYTFSDESDSSELVFYGSSNRVEVATGSETTITVNGNEVTIGATYVSDGTPREATVTVNGRTENVEEGDTVGRGRSGNIRVSDIYRTGPDGAGRVAFSQGSNELVIDNNGNVEVDGEDVDGVSVSGDVSDFSQVEELRFNFGAEESDQDFVEAGTTYEDPLFGLEFHYGGLNPNTAENPTESVQVSAEEDDVSEVTFTTAEGEDASVTVYNNDNSASNFGTEDGTIAQYEGQNLTEDDQVVLNAFEEADMYEVTNIDDADLASGDSDGSVSVTLENTVTGDTVEVEESGVDFSSGSSELEADGSYKINDESIEGKDFDVTLYGDDKVSLVRSTADGDRQLWPSMYTSTDSAVTFDAPGPIDLTEVFPDASAAGDTVTADIPSGIASNDATLEIDFSTSTPTITVQGSFVKYDVSQSGNELDLARDDNGDTNAGVLFVQPEDDDDQEEAYVVNTATTSNGQTSNIGNYTGSTRLTGTLDDEDVDVAYDEFGAYTTDDEEDDNEDVVTINMPDGQSTAGMAVTGPDGSLSADGSSSSGMVESMSPTGWSSQYTALDSDNSVSQAKQNRDLILVGGPSVNSLVSELVQANKTMAASDYTEGQGMLQLVEDAFTQGNDALVVAGYAGEDTRQAGEYLLNYEQNSDSLEGADEVTINTAEGTVVQ